MEIKDKPDRMPTKNWLIKMVALEKGISSEIVKEIVDHEFESARKAMETCKSIEISGFGRFVFNMKKANNKLEKYKEIEASMLNIINSPDTDDVRRKSMNGKLSGVRENFELLTKRIENGVV